MEAASVLGRPETKTSGEEAQTPDVTSMLASRLESLDVVDALRLAARMASSPIIEVRQEIAENIDSVVLDVPDMQISRSIRQERTVTLGQVKALERIWLRLMHDSDVVVRYNAYEAFDLSRDHLHPKLANKLSRSFDPAYDV